VSEVAQAVWGVPERARDPARAERAQAPDREGLAPASARAWEAARAARDRAAVSEVDRLGLPAALPGWGPVAVLTGSERVSAQARAVSVPKAASVPEPVALVLVRASVRANALPRQNGRARPRPGSPSRYRAAARLCRGRIRLQLGGAFTLALHTTIPDVRGRGGLDGRPSIKSPRGATRN
jgi:hypothetical protein